MGFGGVTYSFAPFEYLMLEQGVGYGFTGVAISTMPKLVLGTVQTRLLVGAGYAAAIPPSSPGAVLHYVNMEAAFEYRWPSGWAFHFAFGAWARPAATSSNYQANPVALPQFRMGFAYWFGGPPDTR